jgi:DNA-binding Lrp family transcriptional regulator
MSEEITHEDLTEIDFEILKKLSEDSRISFRQLAKELKVGSPVTIKNHLEKLEENGFIINFGAKINFEKLGYEIIAIIEVTISKGKMFEVEEKIAENPNVFGVYDITGTYDALILARFKTREELSKMIKDIHKSPNVERTNTHFVLNTIKENSSLTALKEKENKKE